jgi:hypothetical protein
MGATGRSGEIDSAISGFKSNDIRNPLNAKEFLDQSKSVQGAVAQALIRERLVPLY